MHEQARLLVVAHGTASTTGRATTEQLVRHIAAARPRIAVDLCFLDVVEPTLPQSLDATPTVAVPLLLSTGYHVQVDIPEAVAAYPATRVARHLGPHPLLVDVLLDRLGPVSPDSSVVLVGAGSSRPEAAAELRATADLLGERLDTHVDVLTVGRDLAPALAALPHPVHAATYLLAGGQFVSTLRDSVDGIGSVSEPLGVHPALVELVWTRYDEALSKQ